MSSGAERVTITGSCHCGFIKYTCTPTRAALKKANRCNCTFCTKLSGANMTVAGPEDFQLLSPSKKEECGDYTAGNPKGHRYFCQKCGTQVWIEAAYEFFGKTVNIFAINLHSVDQPQESIDLSEVKFEYYDGLHDNFQAGLAEKPWKGGLV